MNKLTVSNPLKEALKQTSGLEAIGGIRNNVRFRKFCWDCGKDKPALGGKVFCSPGGFSKGPARFKCADCLHKSEKAA